MASVQGVSLQEFVAKAIRRETTTGQSASQAFEQLLSQSLDNLRRPASPQANAMSTPAATVLTNLPAASATAGASSTPAGNGYGANTASVRAKLTSIFDQYPDTGEGMARALMDILQSLFGMTVSAAGASASTSATAATGTSAPVISGAPYTGFSPNYPFEGFNFAREQNPGKSAKDAFAYLANQAPAPPWTDKPALGQWFTANIQPGMEQLGHKILSVNGDKFSFTNWQGTFEVDFVRGAGAPGAALAWQVI